MFMCKPEKNKKQSIAVVIIFSLTAVMFTVLWILMPSYRWVYQLLSVFAIIYVINVLSRYTMAQWIYRVEAGSLIIIKQLGTKSTTVCTLDLSESLLLINEMAFREGKGKDKYNGVIHKQFNYCQNLCCSCYCYVFKFQDKNYLIKFEPNELFVKMLNDAIAESKKK